MFEYKPASFGDIEIPDLSTTKTWNDVWPSSDTSWDRYDPMQGYDMTRPAFQPFQLPNQKPMAADNFRVSNFGVEFARPKEVEQGNLLLPFGEGPLNPRVAYDFWNPAQSIDTLATWARATIPGVNDAGNYLGSIGKGIADSWVGKTISESPLAAAGTFAGDTVFGILKGGFQTIGDMLSPIGDIAQSYEKRDFAGMALNTLRIGPAALTQKTWERIQGFQKGDEKLKEELADEFGFILTVGTLGAGAALGLTAKAGTPRPRSGVRDRRPPVPRLGQHKQVHCVADARTARLPISGRVRDRRLGVSRPHASAGCAGREPRGPQDDGLGDLPSAIANRADRL
jgi:hypothetical protein